MHFCCFKDNPVPLIIPDTPWWNQLPTTLDGTGDSQRLESKNEKVTAPLVHNQKAWCMLLLSSVMWHVSSCDSSLLFHFLFSLCCLLLQLSPFDIDYGYLAFGSELPARYWTCGKVTWRPHPENVMWSKVRLVIIICILDVGASTVIQMYDVNIVVIGCQNISSW